MRSASTNPLMPRPEVRVISLTFLTPRLISCVVSISYDRDIPGQDEQAAACHDELVDCCSRAGYYPYRLGIRSMNQISQSEGYRKVLRRIKNALDPEGVLAPGRYDQSAALINREAVLT